MIRYCLKYAMEDYFLYVCNNVFMKKKNAGVDASMKCGTVASRIVKYYAFTVTAKTTNFGIPVSL